MREGAGGPTREERRHPRLPSRQRCWCEAGDITLYAQVGNLSEGGMYLRTQAPLGVGQRVRVSLAGMDLAAAVVWRRPPGDGGEGGVGLRFDELDARSARTLRSQLGRLGRGRA